MNRPESFVVKSLKYINQNTYNQLLNIMSHLLVENCYGDTLIIKNKDMQVTYDTSNLIIKRLLYFHYRDGNTNESTVSQALIYRVDLKYIFFDIVLKLKFHPVLSLFCCEHARSSEINRCLDGTIETYFHNRCELNNTNLMISGAT